MKQNITKEQLNKLTKEKSGKLWAWMIDINIPKIDNSDSELLSIGEMIEFLGDDLMEIIQNKVFWSDKIEGWKITFKDIEFEENNLCDALWKAVKYKLKKINY